MPDAPFARPQQLIAGRWCPAQDERTIATLDPATGDGLAELPRGGAGDVAAAVSAARAAADGAWGRTTAAERGRMLTRLAGLVERDAERLARIEAQDTGKPLSQARADMVATRRYFEYYAGAADKVHGTTIPYLDGFLAYTTREPHGVTAHIIPWNYPAQMFGRTIGAGLAMGNACVLKPAEDACLTTLALAALALEAGVPEGALNVVTGLGEEAGAALVSHPGIDHISFTGSPEVGGIIQAAAATHNVGCTMELGGKSPQLVFADADLAEAMPILVAAVIQNAGQTCSAGSRLLVEQSIYPEVVAALAERFQALTIGSWQQDRSVGPLINAKQLARVTGFVAAAKADGIPVLAEASLPSDLPVGGFFAAPALFGPVPRGNRLACEEVFGPVLSVMPFADEEDAVRLANSTAYGLVAGLWTRDGGRQHRVPKRLRCGQVFVNCYGAGGGIELPFGGVKRSGYGREKGFEALHTLSVTKTVLVKHG
ncbi:MAG: aldehyde dehydrogenase family protein [Alphaproteobacteria bacterium]|nr:aldehyde dehydrogenase family protein [Alphaproteobacteria bacterium]